jgi:hypothetical protein
MVADKLFAPGATVMFVVAVFPWKVAEIVTVPAATRRAFAFPVYSLVRVKVVGARVSQPSMTGDAGDTGYVR